MSLILERLERLPFSSFHRRLLFMGGLGYSFDALDLAILAFILPVLITQWHLAGVQAGALASATYIGYFFGALGAGTAGDIIGRRIVMMWALAIYSVASFASAFAPSYGSFFALRVVAGVGTGAESAIIAPFLAEFVGKDYRGRFIGSLAGFFSIGFLAAALLGYYLVPAAPWGWRLAVVVTSLPVFLLLWWRRALPESPRWLESQGRHVEADCILSHIEGQIMRSEGISLPMPAPTLVQSPPIAVSLLKRLRILWAPPMTRITAMIWILWIAITFSYYSFFTWIPTLLIESGMTITKSFSYSIAIYAAQVPGYYSAAYLNDRIGRRATIVAYMSLGSVAAVALATARSNTWAVVAGMCLSFFMNGTYAGVYAYTAEIFPTPVRTTGTGLASAVGRLGAIGAPVLVGFLFPLFGFAGVFGVTTLILFTGALAVALLGVRTHSLSLEEIVPKEFNSCE